MKFEHYYTYILPPTKGGAETALDHFALEKCFNVTISSSTAVPLEYRIPLFATGPRTTAKPFGLDFKLASDVAYQ